MLVLHPFTGFSIEIFQYSPAGTVVCGENYDNANGQIKLPPRFGNNPTDVSVRAATQIKHECTKPKRSFGTPARSAGRPEQIDATRTRKLCSVHEGVHVQQPEDQQTEPGGWLEPKTGKQSSWRTLKLVI